MLALTLCLVSAEPAARRALARTCVPHPQSLLPAPDALWSLPPATRLLFEAHACTHCLRRLAVVSVNAYNYKSQSHCRNIGGPCRSRLCFSGARLAPTPRARNCVRVLRCVEARALGAVNLHAYIFAPVRAFPVASCCVCAVLCLRTSLAYVVQQRTSN